MSGLTPTHLLLILAVALIVIGPGKLPEVGAALGKSIREFKRATGDLTDTLTTPQANPPAPQAPPPAAYPSPAPYQPAPYQPAPFEPVAGAVAPPPAPLGYPAPAGNPAAGPQSALAENVPVTGTVVEPPPRVG
jgi:sec-independent protein translocase protein TatA